MAKGESIVSAAAKKDREQMTSVLAAAFFAVRLWRFRFDPAGTPLDNQSKLREELARDSVLDAQALMAVIDEATK